MNHGFWGNHEAYFAYINLKRGRKKVVLIQFFKVWCVFLIFCVKESDSSFWELVSIVWVFNLCHNYPISLLCWRNSWKLKEDEVSLSFNYLFDNQPLNQSKGLKLHRRGNRREKHMRGSKSFNFQPILFFLFFSLQGKC
jgi:hypothetical protein